MQYPWGPNKGDKLSIASLSPTSRISIDQADGAEHKKQVRQKKLDSLIARAEMAKASPRGVQLLKDGLLHQAAAWLNGNGLSKLAREAEDLACEGVA